jgi:hypothetical protein
MQWFTHFYLLNQWQLSDIVLIDHAENWSLWHPVNCWVPQVVLLRSYELSLNHILITWLVDPYESIIRNDILGVWARYSCDASERLWQTSRVQAVNISFLFSNLHQVNRLGLNPEDVCCLQFWGRALSCKSGPWRVGLHTSWLYEWYYHCDRLPLSVFLEKICIFI